MVDTTPQRFAEADRALVIAAAGCGKTELIARAVSCHDEGRQLILTHTHAGIRSLRDRLRALGVSSRQYRLDTIAGFALRYAAAYPGVSGIEELQPTDSQQWHDVYSGARDVLSRSWAKRVIDSTYSGIYVDEYQDCSKAQHELVLELAELLPCRIVGDPLQGVFEFEDLVSWRRDILPEFERLSDLRYPWRWAHSNKQLGSWLSGTARPALLHGKSLDLRHSPVKWIQHRPENQRSACLGMCKYAEDSVVAIQKWPNQAHSLAQNLNGAYTSMEEVESRDLMRWARTFSQSRGAERAVSVIEFASSCMTKVSTELASIRRKLQGNDLSFSKRNKHLDIAVALVEVANTSELTPIIDACTLIEAIPSRALYRRELWDSMKRCLAEYDTDGELSFEDTAWHIRDRDRRWGRRVDHRTVSRTLLVKGLEFDHAIVLDARELSTKELYVAMTRGSKSLTVLSDTPIIQVEKPTF